jgi:thiamine-monophosphate kinase
VPAHDHRVKASRRLSELDAIELLRGLLASGPNPRGVEVGIGDDAAVLSAGGGKLVWTIDSCIEGAHFDRRWLSLEDVGWRSFMAAVSDVAAMGATPLAALSELSLPAGTSRAELARLGRGQAAAARAARCPVVGGNVSRARDLAVVTTVLGRVERPLLRSGARAGDELWLVGRVGYAALGLRLLREGRRARGAGERAAVAAWRRPVALVDRGPALAGRASAALDVSDGLAGDAAHLARASAVRVVIEGAALLKGLGREMVDAARRSGCEPLELALHGGEDYALLATGRQRPRFARRIGRIERGEGVWLERPGGAASRITRGGWDHLEPRG